MILPELQMVHVTTILLSVRRPDADCHLERDARPRAHYIHLSTIIARPPVIIRPAVPHQAQPTTTTTRTTTYDNAHSLFFFLIK